MDCLCAFDDTSMNRMSVAICSILGESVSLIPDSKCVINKHGSVKCVRLQMGNFGTDFTSLYSTFTDKLECNSQGHHFQHLLKRFVLLFSWSNTCLILGKSCSTWWRFHAVPVGTREVTVAFQFISECAILHWSFLWIVISLLCVSFSLFLKLIDTKMGTGKICRYVTQWQIICVCTLVSILFPCWVEEMHTWCQLVMVCC
jgi:hypothetical protein